MISVWMNSSLVSSALCTNLHGFIILYVLNMRDARRGSGRVVNLCGPYPVSGTGIVHLNTLYFLPSCVSMRLSIIPIQSCFVSRSFS